MKILFIYPNIYTQIGFNYGVAFLSSALKHHGHKTALISINEKLRYPLDLDRIRKEVEEFGPDLIGFSAVTNQYKYVLHIARSLKEKFSIPLICGGIHATLAPDEVLQSGCFDFVCQGEGEYALLELAEKLEKGEDPSNIANLCLMKDGRVIKNPVRPFVRLTDLPMKDYDIFDFQKMIDAKNGWVGMMASRGCPFNCSYCFNHQMVKLYQNDLGISGRKGLNYIRHHPIQEIMKELEYILSQYCNIKMFIFDDDLFTFNKPYLMKFCREYKGRIGLPFVVNAHVKMMDEEMALALKNAGCRIVKLGLESGSERIRTEVLNRPMKDEEIIRAFHLLEKAGIHTSAFVMIGLPYETKEDLMMTIELLARIKPGRFRWAIFFPYVNTVAYEMSRKGGFINLEKMERLSSFTEESCLDFGPEHNLWIEKLQKIFPWYVNACANLSSSHLYKSLVKGAEALSYESWKKIEDKIIPLDQEISLLLVSQQKEHYAIRYEEFMAVRSDWLDDGSGEG
jgi:radical SAM superfamily enzyme YgiQ (UPF0313 family)